MQEATRWCFIWQLSSILVMQLLHTEKKETKEEFKLLVILHVTLIISVFISFIRKRLTKPSCIKDQSLCWKHKSQTATSEQSFLMSVLRGIIIFARTWQPNVLIKEHPDRKANFDKPYSWLQDFLTNYNSHQQIRCKWWMTMDCFHFYSRSAFSMTFKFIFCLYRGFLIVFSSCEKSLSDKAVAKIALTLVEPGIHPIYKKTQNSFFKMKRR